MKLADILCFCSLPPANKIFCLDKNVREYLCHHKGKATRLIKKLPHLHYMFSLDTTHYGIVALHKSKRGNRQKKKNRNKGKEARNT